jgi:hypothetical protein
MFGRVMLLSIVAILGLTSTAPASAANTHITIAREVLLEEGVAASPRVIIRAVDGGYVIAGALHDNQGWATRIDRNMNVIWRHEVPHPSLTPAEGSSVYESAVALPDDTTLLCGSWDVGRLHAPNVVGLLTRIDASGRVLDQRQVVPLGDNSYKLTYIQKCVRTNEGIAVVANATQILGTGPVRSSKEILWLLGLSPTGEMIWQKVIPRDSQSVASSLRVLPNSDLLVRSGYDETILFDRVGSTITEKKTPPGILMRSIEPDESSRIISQSVDSSPIVVTTLGSNLQEIVRKTGRPSDFKVKQAYEMTGGDLALFGLEDEGGASTAAVSWLRHDLQDMQTYIFKPTFGSAWIVDAVPTETPGEFATVRLVLPAKHNLSPSETRLGLLLSFIQIR